MGNSEGAITEKIGAESKGRLGSLPLLLLERNRKSSMQFSKIEAQPDR